MFRFKSLKERYRELILSKVLIKEEDLTEEESSIIDVTYELFEEKLGNMIVTGKLLNLNMLFYLK